MNYKNKKFKAIDFFCGGGGMTCGLLQSGIDVIAGIDYDVICKETYEKNNTNSKFIHADITKYNPENLIRDANIKVNDDNLIFVGCSPCQYWSVIQTNKTKSTTTKNLIHDFMRFVEFFKPGFVVVENVPGILGRKNESLLHEFIDNLEKNDYLVKSDVINLNYYGVPQSRKRFSLIASRVCSIELPKPDSRKAIIKDFIGLTNGFEKINAAHTDTTNFQHTTSLLKDINLKRLANTKKNGGSRLEWKDEPELQLNTYKGRDREFPDNYGRMSWDKPAPTITTKFNSISNGRFAHPDEDRGISIREGATLQTFPKSYVFYGNGIGANAKIIGNAVPPEYAKRIGKTIIESVKNAKFQN